MRSLNVSPFNVFEVFWILTGCLSPIYSIFSQKGIARSRTNGCTELFRSVFLSKSRSNKQVVKRTESFLIPNGTGGIETDNMFV